MKSTLVIMLIATLLFVVCNTVVCASDLDRVVIVYDPDTGTAKPIVVIGDE